MTKDYIIKGHKEQGKSHKESKYYRILSDGLSLGDKKFSLIMILVCRFAHIWNRLRYPQDSLRLSSAFEYTLSATLPISLLFMGYCEVAMRLKWASALCGVVYALAISPSSKKSLTPYLAAVLWKSVKILRLWNLRASKAHRDKISEEWGQNPITRLVDKILGFLCTF